MLKWLLIFFTMLIMRKILFLPFWTTAGSSFPGSVGSKLSTFIDKLIVVQTLLLGWLLSRKLVFYLLLVLLWTLEVVWSLMYLVCTWSGLALNWTLLFSFNEFIILTKKFGFYHWFFIFSLSSFGSLEMLRWYNWVGKMCKNKKLTK